VSQASRGNRSESFRTVAVPGLALVVAGAILA